MHFIFLPLPVDDDKKIYVTFMMSLFTRVGETRIYINDVLLEQTFMHERSDGWWRVSSDINRDENFILFSTTHFVANVDDGTICFDGC